MVFDLVANTPQNNRRMIDIPANHTFNIPLPPFFEPKVVVTCIFAIGPHIKGFVDDQHPQVVAGIEKSRRRRIMRTSDCIKATGFQQFNATFLSPVVRFGTKRSIIMVKTTTFQFQGFTIQLKSVYNIKSDGSDSKFCFDAVNQLTSSIYFIDCRIQFR